MFCASNRVVNSKVFHPEYMDVFNPWGLSFFLAGGLPEELLWEWSWSWDLPCWTHHTWSILSWTMVKIYLWWFLFAGAGVWRVHCSGYCRRRNRVFANHKCRHCATLYEATIYCIAQATGCELCCFWYIFYWLSLPCFLLPCVGWRYWSLCQISQCTKVSLIVRFGEVV